MVLSALHKGLGSGKPRRRHRLPLLTSLLLCLCLATGCMAMPSAQTSGTETAETTSPSESPMEEGQAQGASTPPCSRTRPIPCDRIKLRQRALD